MYEIVQFKADDEFFFATGIEKEQLEKLRASFKRDTTATTVQEPDDLISVMSS